jgi:hypothetical protein
MSKGFIEDSISERHDYTRQIFQISVAWFTFFITVNYAAMGWLAPVADNHKNAVVLIALLFLVQNGLGITICAVLRCHFAKTDKRIHELQLQLLNLEAPENPATPSSETAMPRQFYSICMILMIVTMSTIIITWCIIPFVYGNRHNEHYNNYLVHCTLCIRKIRLRAYADVEQKGESLWLCKCKAGAHREVKPGTAAITVTANKRWRTTSCSVAVTVIDNATLVPTDVPPSKEYTFFLFYPPDNRTTGITHAVSVKYKTCSTIFVEHPFRHNIPSAANGRTYQERG